MLIQIQSGQIPVYWEIIKFAAIKSAAIEDEFVSHYCTVLLQDLLSSKKICFVHQKDDKVILLFIISLKQDLMKGYKYLYINNLYSFEKQEDDVWIKACSHVIKFAERTGCYEILWDTSNERVMKIGEKMKPSQAGKIYKYKI